MKTKFIALKKEITFAYGTGSFCSHLRTTGIFLFVLVAIRAVVDALGRAVDWVFGRLLVNLPTKIMLQKLLSWICF